MWILTLKKDVFSLKIERSHQGHVHNQKWSLTVDECLIAGSFQTCCILQNAIRDAFSKKAHTCSFRSRATKDIFPLHRKAIHDKISEAKMRRKTRVELPSSKYDIEYVLGSSIITSSPNEDLPLNPRKAIKRCLQKTTNILRRRKSNLSAFEQKIMELDQVTRRDGYGDGTAVMYIREIFEPGDAEYDYIGSYVCASKLSHEQVDRLRIMILPARREETLLSYLDYYKNAYQHHHIFNESTDVVRHFEGFHRRYSKLGAEDGGEKFDLLFSFTFAIKIYCGWILKFESTKRRAKMIAALAKLWRKLFGRYTPAELGTLCFTISQSSNFGLLMLTITCCFDPTLQVLI